MQTDPFDSTWETQGLFGFCSCRGLTLSLHLKSLPESPVGRGWRGHQESPRDLRSFADLGIQFGLLRLKTMLLLGSQLKMVASQGWRELLRPSSPSPEMTLQFLLLQTYHKSPTAVFGKLPGD